MLQPTTILSTTTTEYMVAIKGAKEALWVTNLVTELGLKQERLVLYYNSMSVIHLVKNQVYHSKTKHIDVRYH